MQSFYGKVLRDNRGNAKEMAKATRAILKHYASTPENPQHEDCLIGRDSWCSFQKDIAWNTREHKPIKDPLPPAVGEVAQEVFTKLGSESFLAGCERVSTPCHMGLSTQRTVCLTTGDLLGCMHQHSFV